MKKSNRFQCRNCAWILFQVIFLFVAFPDRLAFSAEHPQAREAAFHINSFDMSADGSGSLLLEGPDLPKHLELRFQAAVAALQEPLTLSDGNTLVRALVSDQTLMSLAFAVGYNDIYAAGFVLPVLMRQTGEFPGQDLGAVDSSGLGDLRLFGKGAFYQNPFLGLDISISSVLYLPTGTTTGYVSYDGFAWRNVLAAQWQHKDFYTLVNLGYHLQPERPLLDIVDDDKWIGGLGFKYRLPDGIGEVGLDTVVRVPVFEMSERAHQMGIETALGLKIFWDQWVFSAGGGAGVLRAYGVPGVRGLASAGYRYQIDLDSDKDGILYFDDLCPDEPEDIDGVEDTDGCIEPDDDFDGILDVDDKCPLEPEDKDGFEDDDGCVDLDNDGDGIYDTQDKCVDIPEDKDGFQDDDGCPDLDHDGDKILNDQDLCPEQPEDFDDFEDQDGCPDTDNDQDGIPDAKDQCPFKKETYNENADEDGCPDKRLRKVVITSTEIKIPHKILFKRNKSNIKKKSKKILNKVVKALKRHPEVLLVMIEGHTDQTGSTAYNMKLSQERADTVRTFLTRKGIAKSRLQTHGFGATRIIDMRKTEKAAKRNRRVQFKVIKMKTEERLLEDHEELPEGAVLKEVISTDAQEAPKKELKNNKTSKKKSSKKKSSKKKSSKKKSSKKKSSKKKSSKKKSSKKKSSKKKSSKKKSVQ